ncbi:hypothetical protein ACP70R_020932 [Stipagrostis hirtigluma subsp. patula]
MDARPFSVNFIDLKPKQPRTGRPTATRVLQLLDDHHPWKMVHDMALVIIDQTYSALLEILGAAAPPSGGGHVEVSRPVDPADPDSPLLCVNASATHCCISLINGYYRGGTAPGYRKYASPGQKSSITVSPGTLRLSRVDGGGRGGCWKCAEVRPNVSEKGLLGVPETIRSRLDAAIRVEARLIEMASAAGCGGAKVGEIVEAQVALEKMREQVDLDAIIRRRRCQKRRRLVQEISCGTDVGQADDADYEAVTKRLTALHVSQKRRRLVPGMSCRPAAEVGDEALLAKRLGALHV